MGWISATLKQQSLQAEDGNDEEEETPKATSKKASSKGKSKGQEKEAKGSEKETKGSEKESKGSEIETKARQERQRLKGSCDFSKGQLSQINSFLQGSQRSRRGAETGSSRRCRDCRH